MKLDKFDKIVFSTIVLGMLGLSSLVVTSCATRTVTTEPVVVTPKGTTTPVTLPTQPDVEVPTQLPGPVATEDKPEVKPVTAESKDVEPLTPKHVPIKIGFIKQGFNSEQMATVLKAEALLYLIYNSKEYKDFMMTAKFTSTLGMTNQQIYAKIISGSENLKPEPDHIANAYLDMYYKRFTKVIGYGYPSDLYIHLNLKFYAYYDECEYASNLGHEHFGHKVGFDHSSATEFTSVPYQQNVIIERLCEKAKQNKLTAL